MIRILVVESCHLMRIGLIQLLSTVPNFEVIAGACNGGEAVQITQEQSIDMVLTELELPELSGVEAVRQMLIHNPHIKAIAITAYPDECSLVSFLAAGGHGYLTKDASLQKLAHAIGAVAAGKTYVDPEIVRSVALKRLSKPSQQPSLESLLRREIEILKMISQGMNGLAIAEALRINPKNVNLYRYRLYQQLGVKNDVELALAGIRMGILECGPATVGQKSLKIRHLSLVPRIQEPRLETEKSD